MKRNENFEGILVASTWSFNGNIIGVSLHTNLEEEFIIEMNGSEKQLIPFCQNKGKLVEKFVLTPLLSTYILNESIMLD
ncbi:hypothetical protein N9N67_08745 [Bacteriovoracaceae bacterium]|nr:hypothetical protein [Bacteriovoracaceae bacterium]